MSESNDEGSSDYIILQDEIDIKDDTQASSIYLEQEPNDFDVVIGNQESENDSIPPVYVEELYAANKSLIACDMNVINIDSSSSCDEVVEPPKKRTKIARIKVNKSQIELFKQIGSIKGYKKHWEELPELKPWLSASVKGRSCFYCRLCKIDKKLSKSEILCHMLSDIHKKNMASPPSEDNKTGQLLQYKGLLCPVFTPFEYVRSKTVNFEVIEQYGNYLKSSGIKAILVNDIIGEGVSLTVYERKRLLEIWCKFCKENDIFVMVQVGGAPFKYVVELARHAESLNVGAIVLMPDMYHIPKSHLDLIRYIKFVASRIGSTPILYHHSPKYNPVHLNLDALLADITGEVDTFAGLICSSISFIETLKVLKFNPNRFVVFMGADEDFQGATVNGFTCIMSSILNLLPKYVHEACYGNGTSFNPALAAEKFIRKTMSRVYKFGKRHSWDGRPRDSRESIKGTSIPCLKAAMSIISKVPMTVVREPLETLWEGHVTTLKENLDKLRF